MLLLGERKWEGLFLVQLGKYEGSCWNQIKTISIEKNLDTLLNSAGYCHNRSEPPEVKRQARQ